MMTMKLVPDSSDQRFTSNLVLLITDLSKETIDKLHIYQRLRNIRTLPYTYILIGWLKSHYHYSSVFDWMTNCFLCGEFCLNA